MYAELKHLCLLYGRFAFKNDHFQFCSDGTGVSVSRKDGNISTTLNSLFPPKCRIFIMDYLKYEMLKCLVK